MATVDGRNLYKAPATGRMTTANVISTCKRAGMDAACYNKNTARSKCTLVNSSNNMIFIPMAKVICPEVKSYKCKSLQNVFVYYTGDDGDGFGLVDGSWKFGSDQVDKFALCVS